MRCDDVIRELTDPVGSRDDDALTGHLAHCGRCSAEAARIRRFERLWESTRPAVPSDETWERAWARIQSELDRRDAGTGKPHLKVGQHAVIDSRPAGHSRSSSRWHSIAVIGILGMAQAAALLLAIGLTWRNPVSDPHSVANPPGTAVARAVETSLDSEFDFEDGQVPLIRTDGKTVQMVDLTERDSLNGEDPWMEVFNRVEGTSFVMAMAE